MTCAAILPACECVGEPRGVVELTCVVILLVCEFNGDPRDVR
jgi:hypothetical protein